MWLGPKTGHFATSVAIQYAIVDLNAPTQTKAGSSPESDHTEKSLDFAANSRNHVKDPTFLPKEVQTSSGNENQVDQFKSAKFSVGGNSFPRVLLCNVAERVWDLLSSAKNFVPQVRGIG